LTTKLSSAKLDLVEDNLTKKKGENKFEKI